MTPTDFIMIAASVVSLAIAVVEYLGIYRTRAGPEVFIVVSIICLGRVALRKKMQGREQQRRAMIDQIPKRPLGLMDDDEPVGQTTSPRESPVEVRRDTRVNPMLSDVPKRPLGIFDDEPKSKS